MPDQGVHRDIVVIGASAGGLQPLSDILSALPAGFPASVLIVLHQSEVSRGRLPDLLQRFTELPVALAEHLQPLEPGRVYVAPPDRHLLVRPGHIELSRGPRENHTRPAVDPLFRTAARAYGERVIGVVLSGTLYDGSGGLMAINAADGVAIVQDPADASASGMPESAILHASIDYVLPSAEIAARLIDLVGLPIGAGNQTVSDHMSGIEHRIQMDFDNQSDDTRAGESTMFTCPDCGGVLWQDGVGAALAFRCHVGHTYAPEALLGLKTDDMEAALWACVRMLKEKSTLSRQMATRYRKASANGQYTERLAEQAERDDHYVELLKSLLEQLPDPVGSRAAIADNE